MALILVGLFLLGGVASLWLGGWGERRASGGLALAVAGIGFALALLLRLLRSPPLTFSHWQAPALLAGGLSYRADGLASGLVIALVYINLIATFLVLVADKGSGETQMPWGSGLLLAGAALSFILSDSLLTLCFSWGLAVLAILLTFARMGIISNALKQAAWALLIASLAGLVLVAALVAGGIEGSYQNLAVLSRGAPLVLALAALVWMGAFPFHLWWPRSLKLRPTLVPFVYYPLMGMGMYALLRAGEWEASAILGQDVWLWLGAASMLGGAVLVWGDISPGAKIFYLLGSQMGYLLLSLAIPAGRSFALAGLEVLNLLLSGSILFLGIGFGGRSRWGRMMLVLATASLLGVPPTPGFWMRWAIYQDLLEAGQAGFILVGIAATFLLWQPVAELQGEGEGQGDRAQELALALLALPLVLEAIYPRLGMAFMPLSGLQWEGLDPWRMLTAASHSALLWASCLFPLIAGYLALRGGALWRHWLEVAMQQMARALDVAWLLDVLAWLLRGCAEGLRRMALILEGEYGLGWTVLWSIVVMLLLLSI